MKGSKAKPAKGKDGVWSPEDCRLAAERPFLGESDGTCLASPAALPGRLVRIAVAKFLLGVQVSTIQLAFASFQLPDVKPGLVSAALFLSVVWDSESPVSCPQATLGQSV